ncbi:MAG TPA: YidB family protein [Casimicrobiaceae bacterium]|nr:YidB family protein [Casimicrobiaceae bacterium]
MPCGGSVGLLDGVLGNVMGGLLGGQSAQGGQNPLMQMALQMLQQNGGLQGVLGKFEQSGLGQQAQSWVGTGPNQSIDGGALSQVFGSGQIGQIAQQLGLSHDQAAGQLAQVLPQVIDKLTPQGQVPDNHSDLVNQALALLQKGKSAQA